MRRGPALRAVCALALAACAAWCAPAAYGARILAIETMAGRSHWNFMSAVLRALTDNGHTVTAFTPFADGDRENYTEVDTSAAFPAAVDMDLAAVRGRRGGAVRSLRYLMRAFRHSCEALYGDGRLGAALAGRLRRADYDAIVIEPGTWRPRCLTYVAARSAAPLIFAVPLPADAYADRRTTGHYRNPATASSTMAGHAVPRTFAQRFGDAVTFACVAAAVAVEEYLLETFDPRPYDGHAPAPPSVVFINSHYVSDAPRPVVPNVVSVGGIHLRPPKRIPDDILEFIENSPRGVILFTFGSTIAMSSIPKNIQKIFIEVFAQLPQRVLMKYEGELEDKPENVMTKPWLPQRDILMHKNVKLFISHGGISGVYEAVDAGVPVLGFPLFGDQARNIDGLVEAGMAISMEVLSVSKDSFLENIIDLTNNTKYKENAKITSEIFKDRPMSPEKSVVYWTEYVIRHKGAPHLKSHALNLTWYQYMLLDVIAVIFIILFIVYRMFKFIYKCIIKGLYLIKTKSE